MNPRTIEDLKANIRDGNITLPHMKLKRNKKLKIGKENLIVL